MKKYRIGNVAMAIATIGFFSSSTVYAHEPRVIGGDCTVEVGWLLEPPLEDQDNQAILIIEDCGGDAEILAEEINITIKALRLETDSFDAPVLNESTLGTMEAIDNFASKQLTPSIDGAYGLVLNGTIAGRPIVNEKFVCGGGSQSADEAFECVENPKVFPGPAFKRYVPN